MLENSKDILYTVLAVSIFLFTIFICWAIFYLAMILREFKKIIGDVRKKIELVEEVLVSFKDKIEKSSSYLKLLVESAGNLLTFLKERKEEKGGGKKKK
jgi:hypothetical protein